MWIMTPSHCCYWALPKPPNLLKPVSSSDKQVNNTDFLLQGLRCDKIIVKLSRQGLYQWLVNLVKISGWGWHDGGRERTSACWGSFLKEPSSGFSSLEFISLYHTWGLEGTLEEISLTPIPHLKLKPNERKWVAIILPPCNR